MLAELNRDKELIDRLLKDAALSLPAAEYIALKQAVIKMLDKYERAVTILNQDNNQTVIK